MAKNSFVLPLGAMWGQRIRNEDDEPFARKMARLVVQLREQQAEGAAIAANLDRLGFGEV